MILVRLQGGLGNQMFQYAFGKSLALKNKTDLYLDLSLLGEKNQEFNKNSEHIRYFDLDVFKLPDQISTNKISERFNGKTKPNLLERIKFKFSKFWDKKNLYVQDRHKFEPEKYLNFKGDLCVVGRFQSEKFFKENTTEIKRLFCLDNFQPTTVSLDLLNRFEEVTKVAIHVRRKDYVTDPLYSRTLGALDMSYYYQAVEEMKNLVSDKSIVFFVISDDILFCKKNFGMIENVVFVDQERSKVGFLSDFWLLTKCDHWIISNSTFAWWGSWIGEKETSIVLAPKNWTRDKGSEPTDIVPDHWIKIENKFEAL